MGSRFIKIEVHLWMDTKTGTYFVRKSFKREHLNELNLSTGQKTLGKARTRASVMIAEHLASGGRATGRNSKRMYEVIEEILRVEMPRKRKTTQDQYKRFLTELKDEWGRSDLNSITLSEFDDWLIDFRSRKPNRTTFMDYAKYMNKIFSFAYQRRYVSHKIVFRSPDEAAEEGRVYTRDEVTSVYDHMGEELRDQFTLSLECFMRLREVLKLTWERVDLKTGAITLRKQDVKTGSKTGKGRTFIMSPHALERLQARYAARTSDVWVFPSPTGKGPVNQNKKAWATAKKRAGIRGVAKWHALRHTALTWALLDQKANPLMVSEYAGVSIATIQKVYLHSTAEKTAEVSTAVTISRKGVEKE